MPGTTICKSWFQPRMMMPLSITLSTRTPSSVPNSEPRPPVRLVPPRMTAAIDRQLEAAAGGRLAGVHQRGQDQPGEADVSSPVTTKTKSFSRSGPHAREPHRLLVGADRIDDSGRAS